MGHRSELRRSYAGPSTLDVPRPPHLGPGELLIVGLEFFVAVGAFAGGGAMLVDSTGRTLGLRGDLLGSTPFASFLIPGLVLLILNGLIPAAVAIRAIRRRPVGGVGHFLVAFVLGGWMIAETVLIGVSSWMQPAFLGVAVAIGLLAVRVARADRPRRSSVGREFACAHAEMPAGAAIVTRSPQHRLGRHGERIATKRTVTSAPTAARIPSVVEAAPGVDLYWLPLGAGARVVRISGGVFEALSALLQNRPRRDLYHSALEVVTTDGRFVIEMTPIPNRQGHTRGVVAEGAVGTNLARRFRLFRYEIRRWHGGDISDRSFAVSSPVHVVNDSAVAQRLLDHVPHVPTLVWGRDELHAGEMWNSNSVTAWLLASIGVDPEEIEPPPNGRAPGWAAGLVASGIQPGPAPLPRSAMPPQPVRCRG